jgi:hypothetical protein
VERPGRAPGSLKISKVTVTFCIFPPSGIRNNWPRQEGGRRCGRSRSKFSEVGCMDDRHGQLSDREQKRFNYG